MESPLFDILPTPYGGRSAFAREAIPKGTPVLFCSGPYASIVLWKFRREVCAACYAYAFESGKSKWSVRLGEESKGAGGAWFCSEACRDIFMRDMELVEGEGVGWWMNINIAFEKLLTQMGKAGKQASTKAAAKARPSTRLVYLEEISPADVTPEVVDKAWAMAEEVVREENKGVWKMGWVEVLSEFEIDTARFVLDGLMRKAIEDTNPLFPILAYVPVEKKGFGMSSGRWTDMLDLQDNELPLVASKPSMLASRIRIYRFLAHLVNSIPSQPRPRNGMTSATPREEISAATAHFTDSLRSSLSTSFSARAIMARDHGNVFGIWDMAPEGEESEMLGWGAYLFGSYFNHDCSPNLKKVRVGRGMQFQTLRDVLPGAELCISYVDETAPPKERRGQLEVDWFFVCRCTRCIREMDGDGPIHS